jgi:hypothetical protein
MGRLRRKISESWQTAGRLVAIWSSLSLAVTLAEKRKPELKIREMARRFEIARPKTFKDFMVVAPL